MNAVRLVAHQFRYDTRSLRRNRQALVTTLLLPVLLLVLFVSVGGEDNTFVQDGHTVKAISFFTPGLIAMAIVAAAFGNLVVDLVVQREGGVLKRRRAAPVPAWALIAGRTATALSTATVTSFVLLAIAGNRYDLKVSSRELVTVAASLVLGVLVFSALSYAIAPTIRSAAAIQPIVQLVLCRSTSSPVSSCRARRTPAGSTTSQRRCRSSTSPTVFIARSGPSMRPLG